MSTSIQPSPTPIDFNALLLEFHASGQSAAAFARSKGLAPRKIYNALQRRSRQARAARVARGLQRNALLPVHVVDARPAKQSAALELLIAGRHRVLIGADFDAPTLRRLVEALAPC